MKITIMSTATLTFSLVMVLITFALGLIPNTKLQLSAFFWAYTAWLVYKDKKSELVDLCKYLLWIKIILLVAIGVSIASGKFIDTTSGVYTKIVIPYLLFASVIDFLLLKYFESKNIFKKSKLDLEDNDEHIWESIDKEFNSVERKSGLWAKVLTISEGNETIAKTEYMKRRVQQLKDEMINAQAEQSEETVGLNNVSNLWGYMGVFKKAILIWVAILITIFLVQEFYKN